MIAKLLLLHFIADFVLQPREMGKKKSQDVKWLLGHLAIQFAIFAPFTSILFALANCAVHGLIDWYIWRGYKWSVAFRNPVPWHLRVEVEPEPTHQEFEATWWLGVKASWKYWEDHLFYTTIGFDQLLHGLTLVVLSGWML